MKKRILCSILSLLLLFCSVPAFAENSVEVLLNGAPLEFDVPAQIVDGRTMVPMRKIFESLGANVQWLNEHQLITATRFSKIMSMKIGSKTILIQSTESDENVIVKLDVAPFIDNGRTLVPLRAVAECLDADVVWVAETRTVQITTFD